MEQDISIIASAAAAIGGSAYGVLQARGRKRDQNQIRENRNQQRLAARQQLELQSVSVRVRARSQEQLRPTGRGSMPVSSRFLNFGTFFGGG